MILEIVMRLIILGVLVSLIASSHAASAQSGVGLHCGLARYLSKVAMAGRYDLSADGSLVAMTTGSTGIVRLVDYSDPSFPVTLANVDSGFDQVALFPDLDGDALALSSTRRLDVALLDVSDAANPVISSVLSLPEFPEVLDLTGDRLYASNDDQLWVYDVSDLANPALIGSASLSDEIEDFVVEGGLLYAAQSDQISFRIYDITDPGSGIVELGSANPSTQYEFYGGIAVHNGLATITDSDTLYLYDVSDPSAPEQIRRISGLTVYSYWSGNIGEVAFQGDQLAVSWLGGVNLYDISNAESPVLVRRISGPENSSFPRYACFESGVLIAAECGSWHFIDTDTPIMDHAVSSTTVTSGRVSELVYQDGLLYTLQLRNSLAGQPNLLLIVDPAIEGSQTVIGSVQIPGTLIDGLAINGDHAFVAYDDGIDPLLASIDISDPTNPVLIQTYTLIPSSQPSSWNPLKIVITGSTLCVVGEGMRILALDVSEPDALEELSDFGSNNGDTVNGIAAGEDHLVVVTRAFGGAGHYFSTCHIVNLTDPTAPSIIGRGTDKHSGGIHIHEGIVYVSGHIPYTEFGGGDSGYPRNSTLTAYSLAFGVELDRVVLCSDIANEPVTGFLHELYASNGFLYASTEAGTAIVDISDTRDLDYLGYAETGNMTSLTGAGNTIYGLRGNRAIWTMVTEPECLVCVADITGDGQLDIFDVYRYLTMFNASDPAADLTGDGSFDIFDIFAYLDAYNAGCP